MTFGSKEMSKRLRQATKDIPLFGANATQHAASRLWNGHARSATSVVVKCATTAEVKTVVQIAADYGMPVAVLAGGHDWAGRASAVNGVTIDLRAINSVAFNATDSTVTLGGGALINDVLEGTPDDQVVVAGTVSTVGMAGLTMGGGYGKLNSRFGLALDNMVRAEVVLADGTIAVASAQDDADLFWALRGGGGNFGTVTSMTLAAHLLPEVLSGLVFVPLHLSKAGLLDMQSILHDSGDNLSIFSALMMMPSGDRGLVLGPLWSGEPAQGERVLRRVAGLSGAYTIEQHRSRYRETYSKEFEAGWPKGRGYGMDAVNLGRLDEAMVEALVESARTLPSEADCIMLHDFHGACTRVASDSTAFSLRDEHFNVELLAGWTEDKDAAAGQAWLDDTRSMLIPFSTQGGYPNILGPDPDSRLRAREFYGAAAERLAVCKKRYDSTDMFRFNSGRL